MDSSFLLKNLLFLPLAQQDAKELVPLTAISLLYGKDVHPSNPYFHTMFE